MRIAAESRNSRGNSGSTWHQDFTSPSESRPIAKGVTSKIGRTTVENQSDGLLAWFNPKSENLFLTALIWLAYLVHCFFTLTSREESGPKRVLDVSLLG